MESTKEFKQLKLVSPTNDAFNIKYGISETSEIRYTWYLLMFKYSLYL